MTSPLYFLLYGANKTANWIQSHKIYTISYVLAAKYQHKKITLSKNRFLNFDEVFEWPDMKKAPICTTGTCRGTKDMIAILSNGDVVSCCLDVYGQAKLGNIFNTSLHILHARDLTTAIRNSINNTKDGSLRLIISNLSHLIQ